MSMQAIKSLLRQRAWIVFVLIVLCISIGAVSSQDQNVFTNVYKYCELTGETIHTELYPVEAEAYFNRKAPASILEDAIAVFGQELIFESDQQRLQMVNNIMRQIADAVEISPNLMYPEGPVMSFGVNWEGLFFVSLHKEVKYDDTMLDQLYAEFEAQSLRAGLKNVPVVFQYREVMSKEEGGAE